MAMVEGSGEAVIEKSPALARLSFEIEPKMINGLDFRITEWGPEGGSTPT